MDITNVAGWVSDEANYCVDAKLSLSSASDSDAEMAEAELSEDGEGQEARLNTTLELPSSEFFFFEYSVFD